MADAGLGKTTRQRCFFPAETYRRTDHPHFTPYVYKLLPSVVAGEFGRYQMGEEGRWSYTRRCKKDENLHDQSGLRYARSVCVCSPLKQTPVLFFLLSPFLLQ